MAANYLIELDGKTYEFNPGKEITLAEYEYMEAAFGIEYGGWFTFDKRLREIGHVNAVRCLIWLIMRHFEGHTGTDPRRIDLPKDFEMGQFLEDVRNKDVLDALEETQKVDADPLVGRKKRPTEPPIPDGPSPSENSEPS